LNRVRSPVVGAAKARDNAARCNVAPLLAYDDLRQWLEEAHKLGEVREMSGLTWQRDIGMLAELALRDDGCALLRVR
jgi:hypothetical protein